MKDQVRRDLPWTVSALSSSQMFPLRGKPAGVGVPPGDEGRKLDLPAVFTSEKLDLPISEAYKAFGVESKAFGRKADDPERQSAKRAAWSFIVGIKDG